MVEFFYMVSFLVHLRCGFIYRQIITLFTSRVCKLDPFRVRLNVTRDQIEEPWRLLGSATDMDLPKPGGVTGSALTTTPRFGGCGYRQGISMRVSWCASLWGGGVVGRAQGELESLGQLSPSLTPSGPHWAKQLSGSQAPPLCGRKGPQGGDEERVGYV